MKEIVTEVPRELAERIKALAAHAGIAGAEYEEAIIAECVARVLPELEREKFGDKRQEN